MAPAPTRSSFDEQEALRVLDEADTLEDAAHPFLRAICFALGWRFSALWAVEPGGLRCIDVWRRDDAALADFEEATRAMRFRVGEGLAGSAVSTGEPVWIRDVNLAGDVAFVRDPPAAAVGLHGAFALPLIVRGNVVGVLEFFSGQPEDPDDELLEMLSQTCSRIGRSIESETIRKRLSFQTALLEAQSEAGLDGVVAFSNERRILWWNRRFLEIWGLDPRLMEEGDPRAVIDAAAEKVRDPEPFKELARGLLDDTRTTRSDEIELADGRILDRWTARLRTSTGIEGRVVHYRDVTEQIRAEQRLREDEQWASFLASLGQALSESLDYAQSINRLAGLIVPELGDWSAIHTMQPGGSIRLEALAHVDPSQVEAVRRLQGSPSTRPGVGVGRVIGSGRPELHSQVDVELLEATAGDTTHLAQLRDLHMTSAMIVPLVCRSRVLGAVTIALSGNDRRFGTADLAKAEDVAARAAIHLDNARLYEERERVARTLQRSLLPPRLPDIAGVELAARYHPAGQGTEIGGDFYDAFPVGSRTWGIVIGDVSGKGVDAAAVTAIARHTVRTASLTTRQPSRVLSLLNTALLEETEPDRFCTAIFAFVEARFGRARLVLARGGHPAPVVVRPNGELVELSSRGQLLGVFPQPVLEDVTYELGFGDKIVFYTDGAYEVRTDESSLDHLRFRELLAACGNRGATTAADHLLRHILELQGGQPRDDVALVVAGVVASIFRPVSMAERLRERWPLSRGRTGDDMRLRASRALEGEPPRADDPGVGTE